VIEASWQRLIHRVDPDRGGLVEPLDPGTLERQRETSGLLGALPTLRAALVSIADEAQHIMVVVGADGRVLWRDGSSRVRRKADGLGFVAAWAEGETIRVPAVEPFTLPDPNAKPARSGAPVTVNVSGAEKSMTVRDASGKVLMYAPITVGSEKDPRPVGEWKVTGVSWNPVFNYNPDLFWDADPTHSKAKIPAGPNNPVGIVWVDAALNAAFLAADAGTKVSIQ
jgi:hypothetical protein